MRKWLRRGAIGVLALAVLYVVLGGIGTAMLLNHLLTPGSVDWSGANNPNPPQDPFELGYRGDPRAALGLPFEAVTYATEFGPADAWFVPAVNMTGPWAVYVHGVGGIRENGYRQLSILHEAGIPTMMITYRNDKGAPADPNPIYSFGMTEWPDLDAAMGWMLARGAPGVIIAGESMGAGIAGQFLMHSQQTGKVVALALDAPALDVIAIVADKLGGRLLPFANMLAKAGIAVFDLYRGTHLVDAVSLDEVVKFAGPVFIAHGTSDSLVPIAIGEELVARRTAPTTFVRTNADHLLSYRENPARYRSEMLGFLQSLTDP